MTKLLAYAIQLLRQLPDEVQDRVARAIILQLGDEPERVDREAGDTVL